MKLTLRIRTEVGHDQLWLKIKKWTEDRAILRLPNVTIKSAITDARGGAVAILEFKGMPDTTEMAVSIFEKAAHEQGFEADRLSSSRVIAGRWTPDKLDNRPIATLNLGTHLEKTLEREGIILIAQLTAKSPATLKRLSGIDDAQIQLITARLAQQRLSLAEH